jgi:hypothetical protein
MYPCGPCSRGAHKKGAHPLRAGFLHQRAPWPLDPAAAPVSSLRDTRPAWFPQHRSIQLFARLPAISRGAQLFGVERSRPEGRAHQAALNFPPASCPPSRAVARQVFAANPCKHWASATRSQTSRPRSGVQSQLSALMSVDCSVNGHRVLPTGGHREQKWGTSLSTRSSISGLPCRPGAGDRSLG